MIQMREQRRNFETIAKHTRIGRSSIDAICPWCLQTITIFVWSFYGHGKKLCSCGAAFHTDGTSRKLVTIEGAS